MAEDVQTAPLVPARARRRTFPIRVPSWLFLTLFATLVAAAFATDRNLPVMAPVVAIVWIAGAFYGSLAGSQGDAVVEVGTVYVAVVALYAVFPLVGYMANRLLYAVTNDIRLFVYQPSPREVGHIAWFYVIHLLCFSLAYRIVRGKARFRVRLRPPGRRRVVVIVGLLVAIFGYFWVLGQIFNLSVEEYNESYLILKRLPLLVAQVTNHVGGMKFTLEVAILVILCASFRRYRWLIAVILLAIGASTFARLWSRTEFVLLSAGTMMAYHWLVKPVSERLLAIGAAAVIALFLAAGILRSGILQSEYSVGWNPFAYTNEFESLFANAYDLDQRRADHDVNVSLGFRLADLLALVPQQLSPIAKVEPAVWYANEYYPNFAAAGAAFAFGTISESIAGGGIPDLIGRGVLLGVVLALVHRWASRRKEGFWSVVVYAWTTLTVYQCFRNTTFYLAVLLLYRVLPVILAVEILERVFRGRARTAVSRRSSGAAVEAG